MNKRILSVVGCLFMLGVAAMPAAAAQGNGASEPLVHFRVPFCDGTPFLPGTTENGKATIKETGNGTLIAEVALKNALPNTNYSVRLIQTPSGADCSVFDGFFTTNAQGNGNINIKEAELPTTTGALVFVQFGTDYYSTNNHLFN